MNCKNCNEIIDGKYCPNCGQSAKVDRLTFRSLISEITESVFQVNKGLFFTIKELSVRPGDSIKEYLAGKRKRHFKPIAYAFALSTIYFLLSQAMGSRTFMNDFITGFTSSTSNSKIGADQLGFLDWFAKNYAYTTLLLLPLYSFASFIAFFRTGYNYLEHFVLNAYILGQQAMIYAVTSLFVLIGVSYDLIATFTSILSLIYAVIVFWQFFSEPSRVSLILRSILTYILYLILIVMVMIIAFIIIKNKG